MALSSENLFKIFKQEAEFNYQNKAVFGGLQRLAESWAGEARAEGLPEEVINEIRTILKKYPELPPEERWQQLQIIGKLLEITQVASLNQPTRANPNAKTTSLEDEKENQRPLQKAVQNKTRSSSQSTTINMDKSDTASSKASKKLQALSRNPIADETTGLDAPITVIRGVGSKQSSLMRKLGLNTIEDLLYFFPRRYDDYSALKTIGQLKFGDEITIIGKVITIATYKSRRNMTIVEAVLSDTTGNIRLMWFNQDYHLRYLRKGMFISVSGKVDSYAGRSVITHPDYEPIDQQQLHTNRIVPVYPLTAMITQRWLRRTMFNTIDYWSPRINDFMPESILQDSQLPSLQKALKQVHFPDSQEELNFARQRLAFDEIFILQLGVISQKRQWQELSGEPFQIDDPWLEQQFNQLPYKLTRAQINAIHEIRQDLGKGMPMNRLLQGDVGSGKTVVAALGIGMVINAGAQAAIMAPTSILAEQHFQSLIQLMTTGKNAMLSPNQVRLLTGDSSTIERREILSGLESGEVKLLIGTHALIEDPIKFDHLQMVVVDEQHRFGVQQRAALRNKGNNPHLLVMTATPIPRSLQLTVFGDLDVSVMDEMPAGRQPIETHIFFPRERERAYSKIRSEIQKGNQAFIIYPLVEQGDREDGKAAVEEQQRLQEEVFPHLKLGLMHGRMPPDEKEQTMRDFRDRKYDILVSTSVVEVGVDIPNASVMLIEGANRFGLAQLHQFRGRVGRGSEQSFCILIPDSEEDAENQRLVTMTETNDGFLLAEKDLELRGPGDFLGTRQSGFVELKMASLSNIRLIEKARKFAHEVLDADPKLEAPEHQSMRKAMMHFWPVTQGTGDPS